MEAPPVRHAEITPIPLELTAPIRPIVVSILQSRWAIRTNPANLLLDEAVIRQIYLVHWIKVEMAGTESDLFSSLRDKTPSPTLRLSKKTLNSNFKFIVVCNPGYYESRGLCLECEIGTYKSELGNEVCTPCGSLKTTNSSGNIDNSPCGEFSYQDKNCFICPVMGLPFCSVLPICGPSLLGHSSQSSLSLGLPSWPVLLGWAFLPVWSFLVWPPLPTCSSPSWYRDALLSTQTHTHDWKNTFLDNMYMVIKNGKLGEIRWCAVKAMLFSCSVHSWIWARWIRRV